jgi:AAA family ATP:ADP antiporter
MNRTLLGIPWSKATAALTIALSACSLLCGYEFVRSVSQSLFIKAYGADRLPIVMTLAPVGTLLIVYGYGVLLSFVGAKRAIFYTSFLSGLAILACYLSINAGSRVATGFVYVFREAYIVLLVEQVWAFVNSTVRTDEGSKLNGPICGIASLGAIAGGLLVRHYAKLVGSSNLLVFAALSLIPTGLFAAWAYHIGGEPVPASEEEHGKQGHLGVRVLFRSGTLTRLAILIALTQVISTVTDLQLSRWVEQGISDVDERTRWFGGFYAQLNIGAAFFQFIAAPLLLSWVSLRLIHVAIPLAHVAVGVLVIAHPSLFAAAAAYMVFKVLDYSVFRAAKELLYIPLSFDARYRAKELIDAFGYRFAKGAVSGILTGVKHFVAIPALVFPIAAIAAALAWLPLVAQLTRHSVRMGGDGSDKGKVP